MAKKILTHEYLVDRLDYDPATGVFTHKHNFGMRYRVGDRADTPGHAALTGYRLVNLLNQKFLAHRVAWMYVHGQMPNGIVDHINGEKGDNSINNLRVVTNQVNVQNQRKASKNSKSGLLGALTHAEGVYRARIRVDGRYLHLGLFKTPQEAHEAYVKAKRKYHVGNTL
jgi:hypothetical protein